MDYRIIPPQELPEAEIRLPLSKSMSNRAMIINYLCGQPDALLHRADCDDANVLASALADPTAAETDIDGAGTAMRFLTALYAATPDREVVLTGNERMRHRPIGPLVESLRALGAQIDYLGQEGYPPLKISGRKLCGGTIDIDASMSSQFVSALLMVAPTFNGGLTVNLMAESGSMPYIDLTLSMMRKAGIEAERSNLTITVAEGTFRNPIPEIEPDWSAAAFWYEIEAVSSGFITLLGLTPESAQGDASLPEIFSSLCVTTEFTPDYSNEGPAAELTASPDISPRFVRDLSQNPDLAPAIAVTCSLIGIPFRLSGLATLRLKECDRLGSLQTELKRIGVPTEIIGDDTLEWLGNRIPIAGLPEFRTYGDHRMAMALAPVAIYIPGIKICDAEVVTKSYPRFWDDLKSAGFKLVDGNISYEELFSEEQ